MITKEYNKIYYILVGSILFVVLSITVYVGINNNDAALEKRKVEISSHPIPVEGWGIIKKSIKYPEEYHRAGIDGFADVMFIIDSLGKVKNIRIKASSPVFEDTVKYYLQNIKWFPAKRTGKSVDDSIDCYIRFDSRDLGERFIVIGGKK